MAFSTSIRLPSETYTTHANAPRAAPVRAAAKDDDDDDDAAATAAAAETTTMVLFTYYVDKISIISVFFMNQLLLQLDVKDVNKCPPPPPPPPPPPGDKDDGERSCSVFVPSFSSRLFPARSFHHAMMFIVMMRISRGNQHHHHRSMMMR
jgi:hypothetical protein